MKIINQDNVRLFSSEEAKKLVGAKTYRTGERVDLLAWSDFVEKNVNHSFVESIENLFSFEKLEEMIALIKGQPSYSSQKSIMTATVSCQIAPTISDGLISDSSFLSLGVCRVGKIEEGMSLVLMTRSNPHCLTWGSVPARTLLLGDRYQKAKAMIDAA